MNRERDSWQNFLRSRVTKLIEDLEAEGLSVRAEIVADLQAENAALRERLRKTEQSEAP